MESVLFMLAAGLGLLIWRLNERIARLEREVAALRPSLVPARPPVRAPAEAEGSAGPPAPGATLPDRAVASLFERLVGGRLLIWTGGIALAAAGLFLIRYSLDLFTPESRMIAAALLGLALIGAGEYARGGRWLADDPRIAQALVGAGIAVLYATAYGSHLLFGLIEAGTTALLMAAITAAALALSLRHGVPTAAIGLVGGFLTPALLGPRGETVAVLGYLALLDLALFALALRRGWTWLLTTALAASYAWTGVFILGSAAEALPAGLFAAVLGLAGSLPRQGPNGVPAIPAGVALAELAILAGRDDVGPNGWLLFGGLAAAGVVLAGFRREQRWLPPIALGLALLLITGKADAGGDPLLPWAAVATTFLFAGGGLSGQRAAGLPAATASAALAGPLLIMRTLQPNLLSAGVYGGLALLLAAAAFALAWWARPGAGSGSLVAAGAGAVLAAVGLYDLVPRDLVSGAWLLAAVALLLAGMQSGDKALRTAGLGLLTATVLKVFVLDAAELEGVLRILSFLGLGIALIGIGLLYGRMLRPAPAEPPAGPA